MKKDLYIMISVVLIITIVISGCIQDRDKITESTNSTLTINDDYDKDIGKLIRGSCQFRPPTERVVILRLDDVMGYKLNRMTIDIIDTVLSKNMSITLGVIPKDINNDTIIKTYILGKVKDRRVEIAQHGTNHVKDEYLGLNESETYNLTKSGMEKIADTLNVYPVTFISPYNQYNKNTTRALSKLGFKIISAKRGEYRPDENMMHIGYISMTRYINKNDLVPIDEILKSCDQSLDEKNVCVIMIHPQDYTKEDGEKLDEVKYREFTKLLDELMKLNAQSVTFKDLIICE